MIELELKAISRGVNVSTLMETAGKEVTRIIKERFSIPDRSFLVVCYHGNNGGDGFVVARLLFQLHGKVSVLFLGDREKFSVATSEKYAALSRLKIEIHTKVEEVSFSDYSVIVDALLGIGCKGALQEILGVAVQEMNAAKKKGSVLVSVDVPSGMDPDTGEHGDVVVDADLIVCFHDIKKGLERMREKVVVADIGLGA